MIAPEDYQVVVGVAQEMATRHGLSVRVRHDVVFEDLGAVVVTFREPGSSPTWQASRQFPDAYLRWRDASLLRRWLERELEPIAKDVAEHV